MGNFVFEGDGSTMTGVAMTIAPLAYNPDVSDSTVSDTTGIGITFDHRILAGSGNVTLSIATNAGAAGTTVENFGVGSSVTIQGRKAIIDPTSNLNFGETYHISYPSGCFTNTSGDVDYVGTAYTFGVKAADNQLWAWGNGASGNLGQNDTISRSSPVQIPGITWSMFANSTYKTSFATKKDGTLWIWGSNSRGALGLNAPQTSHKSSPTQIPGTTWGTTLNTISGAYMGGLSIKTDGTLWGWGGDRFGQSVPEPT
jgi:alpha-tubulin suppressor-like RCC1 family protein